MRLFIFLVLCLLMTSCMPMHYVTNTDAYGYLDPNRSDSIIIVKGSVFSVGGLFPVHKGIQSIVVSDTVQLVTLAREGLSRIKMLYRNGEYKLTTVYVKKDVLKCLKQKNNVAKDLKVRINSLPKRKTRIYIQNSN